MNKLYRERFLRFIGIADERGMERIRSTRIAIGGLGLGGSVFIDLVRIGFEKFHVADPDTYERTNINRQRLAKESTIGKRKDDCLIEEARDINPDIDVKPWRDGVKPGNVRRFLEGVDWVVDSVDIFAMADKLTLHAEAERRKLPVASCASIGFSGTTVVFEPGGPTFAELSGVTPQNSYEENFRRFARFITPEVPEYMREQLTRSYNRSTHVPFAVPGVEISAAIVATAIARSVLGIGEKIVAPNGLYFNPVTMRSETFEANHETKRKKAA